MNLAELVDTPGNLHIMTVLAYKKVSILLIAPSGSSADY